MQDNEITQFIAAILPPKIVEPDPCPNCGRRPTLVVGSHLSWYRCKPWWRSLFFLGPCEIGPVVFEGYAASDGDYAQRVSAGAWNRSIKTTAGV